MFHPKYSECKQDKKPVIEVLNISKPYEVKDAEGNLKGYFWYYGNSVDLDFIISGQVTIEDSDSYIDIDQLIPGENPKSPQEEILRDLELKMTIYNSKYDPIIYFSNGMDAEYFLNVKDPVINEETGEVSITATATIDKEISTLKMPKGVYYIDLVASHPSGYCETLFSSTTCTFEVR